MRNSSKHQHGAFIVTAALFLLFLLGAMGLAIDYGRLFVVKTELQTAMDSCALAAAAELDGTAQGLSRATTAGMTAAQLNRVHFQQDAVTLPANQIEFSDSLVGTFSATFTPASDALYVRCTQTRTGIATLLLQAMSGFMDNPVYGQNKSVQALAVATRAPSQTTCMIPVGICQKPGATSSDPFAGFTRGEWLEGVTNDAEEVESGQFRWVDYTGAGGGTREIKDLLSKSGQCSLPGEATAVEDVGKSGKSNGAVPAWNSRFGVYHGPYSASTSPPDLTGYSWYSDSSPPPSNMPGRYDDTSSRGFQYHRAANSPYQGDNKTDNRQLKTNGNESSTAIHTDGTNRRVVSTPLVNCDSGTMSIKAVACVLMLHPLPTNANGKNSKMWLEFITDASATSNNPCTPMGLPGASAGVRVPALVQ